MTDKQIIIHGVDVSECECILEDYQLANNFKGGYEHIKNVCELGERGSEYYNLFCKDNPNCKYKQLKRKEQECEELKEDRERWKSNFYGKVSAIEELLQQLDQLKQTLTKIKEIAEKEVKYFPDGNIFARPEIKQILQKISKYKGEYNEKIR